MALNDDLFRPRGGGAFFRQGVKLPVAPVDRRITWADIAGGLQELYEIFDPEGRAVEVIDAGDVRGGVFQNVTGVW